METEHLSVRLPPDIIQAIDLFQKKQKLEFRTQALMEIVKLACSAVGIDLSKLPESPIETQKEKDDQIPKGQWKCPQTSRMGDCTRCENHSKQYPEDCKSCQSIPKYYHEIIFHVDQETESEEEETEEEPKGAPKEPNQKDDWIACPLKDDWVTKADCDKCRLSNFNVWSNCYNDRRKNPNNPIFHVSKPKPV